MATAGRHGGHYIQKNSRFLLRNLEQLWGHRSFGWTPALCQQTAEANKESTETIVIPRKKTWSKEAVLEALASTVGKDPTICNYKFQDDPYLTPRNFLEFKRFSLSKQSGKAAAKYIVNTFPKFFTKDFAEPHIPCLMPETVTPLLEDVSEEALKERIGLRKVTAAVEIYDKLLQSGTAVSMETSQDLLDLICLFCDKDPVQEGVPETMDMEGSEKNKTHHSSNREPTWKNKNNAERIFNLLPERNVRCYSALIRGMVKHGAYGKAFSIYTDLQNNRLVADVHIFNALISATPEVQNTQEQRWELISELLTQMHQQKVQPNLHTFNAALKSLKSCGPLAKTRSPQILNEMRALGIVPSLASYAHLLAVYQKTGLSGWTNLEVLKDIMSELAGTSFTCQDPEDATFFTIAMKVCLDNKDLMLAYEVHRLLEVAENWKIMGDSFQLSIYCGRFFNIVCMMEHIDVILKWYRQLIPSMYYPNPHGLKDLLRAVDADSRLDLVPKLWKDIRSLGHERKVDVVEEVLTLMAREMHSPEVQESFAVCALDIKKVYENVNVKSIMEWSSTSLSHITSLLLRANKTQQAWEMLKLFQKNNRIPFNNLLEEFLSVLVSDGSAQRAVELVQLSAGFCLEITPRLAQQTLAEFKLTDEQRAIVSELDSAEDPTD